MDYFNLLLEERAITNLLKNDVKKMPNIIDDIL
jgi:hypothetical protein